jgi:hypothetical protein
VSAALSGPRLRGLARTEARLLVRFWVLAAAAIVTGMWVVILQFVPDAAHAVVVPLILLMDVAALGFYFIPSLIVLERSDGVAAAMSVTAATIGERLAVRIGALTLISLVAAAVLLVAVGGGGIGPALAGVAFTSLTFALVAVILVAPFETLTGYMARVPLVAIPLLLPALIVHLGIAEAWPLWLTPVTGQLELMSGRPVDGVLLGWQALWVAVLAVLADRALRAGVSPTPVSASTRRQAPPRGPSAGYRATRAIASFARTDRATLLRDPLLLMIVGGVPALALVARLLSAFGAGWIADHFGVDVSPHLPVIWGLMLVIHTPLMFGSIVGLLFLEDRDARLVPVIATTRASLVLLIGYRVGALMLATAVMLVIGLVIAGASHASGVVGLALTALAAAALAPVPALAMAALAPNRAAGMALMKIIGLPFYLPLASWFVAPPLGLAFGVIPSTWVLWTFWADGVATTAAATLIGIALSAACGAVLVRRLRRA